MVKEFCLKEVRNDMVVRSFSFVKHSERQVRIYNDRGLNDGTIYPVLQKDYCGGKEISKRMISEACEKRKADYRLKDGGQPYLRRIGLIAELF